MIRKEIGKIMKAEFRFGGYQDAMIGFSFEFGSDKDRWGCGTFWGDWSMEPSSGAKWTNADRIKKLGGYCMKVVDLLEKAKVDSLDKLVGIPVECTFEGNVLTDWRILEEVI